MVYQKLWIENFRGLESIAIDDLGRFNVFVGPNNSGKTSVLEATWLLQAPGNPALTGNLAAFRGLGPVLQAPDTGWRFLFNDLDRSRTIEIGGKTTLRAIEKLRISLSNRWPENLDPRLSSVSPSASSDISASSTSQPESLEYVYSVNERSFQPASMAVGLGRIAVNTNAEAPVRSSVFLASRQRNSAEELASRFTTLQDSTGIERLVESLRVLEPDLQDLSIGYRMQGPQSPVQLRAHLKGMASPVPLQVLGEGVGRLTEILLATVEVQRGLLLVDEIENGLYYRNLVSAWSAIGASIVANDVQLLATTHSAECVAAAVTAFNGTLAKDFRLFRIERGIDGIKAVKFDHETAQAALDYEFEFR